MAREDLKDLIELLEGALAIAETLLDEYDQGDEGYGAFVGLEDPDSDGGEPF